MQDHYNLLAREEEREMLPYCLDSGVGVIPWSPLARGKLTRAWDSETNRSETDEFGKSLYADTDRDIVQAVLDVAADRGVAPASVALAWVMRNPVVTAPIVGASKPAAPRRRPRRPRRRPHRRRGHPPRGRLHPALQHRLRLSR